MRAHSLFRSQSANVAGSTRLVDYIEALRKGSPAESRDTDLELMKRLASDPALADFEPVRLSETSAAHPNGSASSDVMTYVSHENVQTGRYAKIWS